MTENKGPPKIPLGRGVEGLGSGRLRRVYIHQVITKSDVSGVLKAANCKQIAYEKVIRGRLVSRYIIGVGIAATPVLLLVKIIAPNRSVIARKAKSWYRMTEEY